MLIIPFERQIDWRKPPVVTLLLITVNLIIFAVWQSGDSGQYRTALAYYFEATELVAHVFLHTGWGQLIGNMLFLLAVGSIVEATLGPWVFGLCYVLLGLGAAVLSLVLRPDELLPLIGASGAIAGVMGLYAVLFGFKRVSFFYFIGVYFDYVKVPAWLLLVLWLGYEIYQQFAFSELNPINYLVHIGGLASGALLAMTCQYAGLANLGHIEQKDQTAAMQAKLAKAQAYLADLELGKAKALFKELLQQQSGRRDILYGLYRAAQIEPASADYHACCQRIFGLSAPDPATRRLVADTLRAYLQKAQPQPQFKPEQLERLAERMLQDQYSEQAQSLIQIMLADPGAHPKLPDYLLQISQFYERQCDIEKARYYQNLLVTDFADSTAAQAWLRS